MQLLPKKCNPHGFRLYYVSLVVVGKECRTSRAFRMNSTQKESEHYHSGNLEHLDALKYAHLFYSSCSCFPVSMFRFFVYVLSRMDVSFSADYGNCPGKIR